MVKRCAWKMNRLESLVLLQLVLRGRNNADCGRRYLDIKNKKGVGDIQKQVRLCLVNSYPRLNGV